MLSMSTYAISDFPFIQIGFVFAVIVPILLMLTFPITKKMSRRSAKRYVGILSWGYVGLAILDIAYAVITGQFEIFIESFGWSTLLEFVLFAAGFFLLMLFMSTKAVGGMPDKPAPKGVDVKGTVIRDGKVVGLIEEDGKVIPTEDSQDSADGAR